MKSKCKQKNKHLVSFSDLLFTVLVEREFNYLIIVKTCSVVTCQLKDTKVVKSEKEKLSLDFQTRIRNLSCIAHRKWIKFINRRYLNPPLIQEYARSISTQNLSKLAKERLCVGNWIPFRQIIVQKSIFQQQFCQPPKLRENHQPIAPNRTNWKGFPSLIWSNFSTKSMRKFVSLQLSKFCWFGIATMVNKCVVVGCDYNYEEEKTRCSWKFITWFK